jgi:hypothetical protein
MTKPVVLRKLDLRGITRGAIPCSCEKHVLLRMFKQLKCGSRGTLLWLPDPPKKARKVRRG